MSSSLATAPLFDRGCVCSGRVFCERQDRTSLNVRWLLLTSLELAEAMKYLHANGIVHGDFKPENILTVRQTPTTADSRGWSVKVADFGTSRVLGYDNQHTLNTTWVYRAPEFMGRQQNLIESHEKSMAGDIYSFGMTLWEMMEARRPFRQFNHCEQMEKWTKEGHRPDLTVQCPPGCKRLLERCWHQSPEQRPSFSKIVDDIQRLLSTLCS